jgi:hypothetical protein
MSSHSEVSIWASELMAGTLPRVCVKSGETADSMLRFRFGELTYGVGRTLLSIFLGIFAFLGGPSAGGQLPLARRWRTTFLVLRGIALGAFPVCISVLFSTGAWPDQMRPLVVGIGFGLFGLYAVAHSLYAVLRPKGVVHRATSGQLWIHLRDVHPNFVVAIQAMEAEALTNRVTSPDGHWYWDGCAWRPTVPQQL